MIGLFDSMLSNFSDKQHEQESCQLIVQEDAGIEEWDRNQSVEKSVCKKRLGEKNGGL